ncbi:MAG: adenylyltransferase/cytidyltransferase family protein [Alistipes sp.]|nr:adenylyltransferase/cytidyltransferase family protein [Alistipes sp.]
MILYNNFDITPPRRTVVAIGSFDGVHRGHRTIIAHLKAMAARLDAESVVVTFDPHPRIALGKAPGMQLLTTVRERVIHLLVAGVDHVVVAHFDDAFRAQPYEAFVRDTLVAKLGMVGMIVGFDHRLGRGSEGTFERLKPLAEECGFDIERVEQYTTSGEGVSSTVVREAILSGDMPSAERLLGGRYMLLGNVVRGIINDIDPYKLLPPSGRYRCRVERGAESYETMATISGRSVSLDNIPDGEVDVLF